MSQPTSLPLQNTTFPAMNTSRTCLGFIIVTIVPGTLFMGQVLILRASSTTMSASLPGRERADLVEDTVGRGARRWWPSRSPDET